MLKELGWGEAKEILFEKIDQYFADKRQVYEHYIHQPEELEKILKKGCERARVEAKVLLKEIKESIGLLRSVSKV